MWIFLLMISATLILKPNLEIKAQVTNKEVIVQSSKLQTEESLVPKLT